MSKKNRAIKPVSFNLLDPEEKELHDHAEKINPLTGKPQNFSKYVKKLIEDDMKREQDGGNNQSGYTIVDVPTSKDEEEYTLEIKSAMSSFL